MNFPLYTSLIRNLPKKDLTILQKNELVNSIKVFDLNTQELIFALIKCYYLDQDKGDTLSIPYKGGLSKDKIVYDVVDLPNGLRQLLYKFVKIHNKRILEDDELNNNIKNIQTPEIRSEIKSEVKL